MLMMTLKVCDRLKRAHVCMLLSVFVACVWRSHVFVCAEVTPGPVTCHFCVFAECGNMPVEKALTILMLLISQHLTLVFSSLCFWHKTEENPWSVYVCVHVCVCVYTPSHLVTSDAAVGSLLCQENPRLAGIPNAYAHTHTCLYTLTHAFYPHVSWTYAHTHIWICLKKKKKKHPRLSLTTHFC